MVLVCVCAGSVCNVRVLRIVCDCRRTWFPLSDDDDEETFPQILTSLPQAMEQHGDLSVVDQAPQHRQQMSSRGWCAVVIATYSQEQI